MAAAIGSGGATGIGAAGVASWSTVDAGSFGSAPAESGDIQSAIWSPTKMDPDQLSLADLLQALPSQSPAASTPTSFGS